MLQQVGSVGFVDACQFQCLVISIVVPRLKATNSTLTRLSKIAKLGLLSNSHLLELRNSLKGFIG